MKKKYKIRHQILGVLKERYIETNTPSHLPGEAFLSFDKIVEKCGLEADDILNEIDILEHNNEILVDEEDETSSNYRVSKYGIVAFNDKKYPSLSKTEFWKALYNKVKTISAIILLLIAIATFILNVFETKKNTKEIERIKRSLNQTTQTK